MSVIRWSIGLDIAKFWAVVYQMSLVNHGQY